MGSKMKRVEHDGVKIRTVPRLVLKDKRKKERKKVGSSTSN
jgi:hypothetical protein